ncbi:MAG: chemotaxis protein CheR, partial [Spirochaetia bacterium]|nr:chemotaxis protein CheR [Spirochaetia bacterium]
LIYFSPEFRAELVRAYHQVLEPGGLLFIGHAEALENHREYFKHLGSSVYQRI